MKDMTDSDSFEEVLDRTSEYKDALEDLQKQLQEGWLSISKARYSLGEGALSQSLFASVGEATQMVGENEKGELFATAAEKYLQGIGASRQVHSVQQDFQKAVNMAVAVLNARQKLQSRVESELRISEPEE